MLSVGRRRECPISKSHVQSAIQETMRSSSGAGIWLGTSTIWWTAARTDKPALPFGFGGSEASRAANDYGS